SMRAPGRIVGGMIWKNCAYYASSNTTSQFLRAPASLVLQVAPLMLLLAAASSPNCGCTVHGKSVGKISGWAAAGFAASSSIMAIAAAASAREWIKLKVMVTFNMNGLLCDRSIFARVDGRNEQAASQARNS